MITLSDIKKKARPIFKKEGVIKAAVFGSFATGYADKKSDIDFLIKMDKSKSLLDLVGIKLNLEKNFRRKVDVITYGGIHRLLKNRILREKIIIYEK